MIPSTGPASHDPVAEAAIPTLTEIIELPPEGEGPAAPAPAELDWEALALRVEENVFERVHAAADRLLVERLDGALQPALERAAAQLVADLRFAVEGITRDLVAQAVATEIARMRAEAAGPTGPQ
jgi:hypothetical protein